MISGFWILGQNRIDGGDQYHDQEHGHEDDVIKGENNTHDTRNHSWLTKGVGEDQQEDSVEEVDSCDRDVECVSLLVHPGSDDADTDEPECFDDEKTNCLSDRGTLGEGNEDGFANDVAKQDCNEVVRSSLVRNIQETPFVETGWI